MENPKTVEEPKKVYTPEQLRAFGKRVGAAPSTINGWIKDGPPPVVMGMLKLFQTCSQLIVDQEADITRLVQENDELKITIRTILRVGK